MPRRPTPGPVAPRGKELVRRRPVTTEHLIAQAIEMGGGIATSAALRRIGVARISIARRLDTGTLVEPFPRVFALPQDALLPSTTRRAAALSCRPRAALAHATALEHLGVGLPAIAVPAHPHVVVPRRRHPRRDTIVVHRVDLDPADLLEHDGAWCTAPARAVYDLAVAGTPRRPLERIVDELAYMGLWRRWDLERLLEGAVDHRGCTTLRGILREHAAGTTRTANDFEEAFLALCDAQGWPRPVCQQPDRLPDGTRIFHDFLWQRLRLIVETDGGAGHRSRRQRRRDQRRDAAMRARGYTVVRLRWADVVVHPARAVAVLAPLLGR